MTTAQNTSRIPHISIQPISEVIHKITSWIAKSPTRENTAPIYSDDDYYRNIARKEIQKRIEKAKYNVYSHRGM